MVRPNGRHDAPIVIVGDAPTDIEMQNDWAFAGELYDLMFDLLGQSDIDIDNCVFVNAVTFQKYYKRGPLTAKDIRPDADAHLIPFIASHPREMVIALGNNALCALGIEAKPEKVGSHRSKRSSSKILEEAGVDALVVATLHPWLILKEPDLDLGVLCDLKYYQRLLHGDVADQAPMEIRDIKTPADIKMLWDAIKKNPVMAYDFETSSLDRDSAMAVTVSFCNGLKNQSGEFIVWFWAGYDKLQPLYNKATMERFIRQFDEFLSKAGVDYDLVGWNTAFDDWIAETWVGHKLPGSQYDGMLMKWSVDNRRPHGLKEATSRFLGYPDYDKEVDASVKEIKARRGRVLKDQADLDTLEYFGLKPALSKGGGKLWTENVDKGLAAYALQEFDSLRTYNCYDSLYTYLLFVKLGQRIEKEDLAYSSDFRHRVAKELLLAEQRGMLCDVETNRDFSTRLVDLEQRCDVKIKDELKRMGFDLPDFNPRGDDLARVLFGAPLMLPFIDAGLVSSRERISKWEASDRCTRVENAVYGDNVALPVITEAIKLGLGVDVEDIGRMLKETYKHLYGDTEITLYSEPNYMQGMYQPNGYTKGGKPSTAGAMLQALYEAHQNPFLALVLMSRRANKLKSTFVDGIFKKLDKNNILRPRFNAIGTETGRISSSNPNGQNFQKNIRGQLIPRKGYRFLEWDLSQAEIRDIAAESGDPQLIDALNSSDIHTRIASLIFKIPESEVSDDTHRRYAKTIVFGLIYGMSAFRLATAINVTVAEAEQFMQDFFTAFPVMKQWLDKQVRLAHKPPYYVYTPWGTRRSTRNVLSVDKGVVSHTERVATNMPIQGGAGELCLWFICEIMDRVRAAGLDAYMVNTTHDSCTLEVREDLVWEANTGELDKKGGAKLTICGPVVDIVNEVLALSPPVYPLDTVNWKADISVGDHWSVKPNLEKALDPNLGKDDSIFLWTLIKPEEFLDKEELEELREVELNMTGSVNY